MASRSIKRGTSPKKLSPSGGRKASASRKPSDGAGKVPASLSSAEKTKRQGPGTDLSTKSKVRQPGSKKVATTTKVTTPLLMQAVGWHVMDVEDGIALHNSQFKSVHYLNHTAAAIYLLCKEHIDVTSLATILREEFGLKRSPEPEVQRIVDAMVQQGLLVRAPQDDSQ